MRPSGPVLVDFWAPWCGPCRMAAPQFDQVAAEGAGRWLIAKLNTEELPQLSARFGIRAIPTMALFRDGREVARQQGAMPAAASDNLSKPMLTIAEKRARFRELHDRGCFALPNPWDIGTARYLQHLGFNALATTSAGFAFSRGVPDGRVGRDAMLAHVREIAEASDLPVNADFENAYADDPNNAAENVRLCIEAGAAGVSLEDNSGRKDQPLYDLELATERVRAAHEAIHGSGAMLIARAECFLVGVEDIDEVIRRLTSYANAGADCLYAPGISEREHVKAVVDAVAPKPVNLLISAPGGLAMHDAEELGVRRVSVGGALARAAWGGFIAAARTLAEQGTFDRFAGATPHGELNEFFQSLM